MAEWSLTARQVPGSAGQEKEGGLLGGRAGLWQRGCLDGVWEDGHIFQADRRETTVPAGEGDSTEHRSTLDPGSALSLRHLIHPLLIRHQSPGVWEPEHQV